jgi:hypothetical protein
VTDVQLQFVNAPLVVPMQKIGGTTWRAELTPDQLRKLAVNGKTMKYRATVVAHDSSGLVVSSKPLELAIAAPSATDVG